MFLELFTLSFYIFIFARKSGFSHYLLLFTCRVTASFWVNLHQANVKVQEDGSEKSPCSAH